MDAVLVGQGQLHRLLTACFLHNSVFHILFNLGYLHLTCSWPSYFGEGSADNLGVLQHYLDMFHQK